MQNFLGSCQKEPDIPAGLQNMSCNPAGISGSYFNYASIYTM